MSTEVAELKKRIASLEETIAALTTHTEIGPAREYALAQEARTQRYRFYAEVRAMPPEDAAKEIIGLRGAAVHEFYPVFDVASATRIVGGLPAGELRDGVLSRLPLPLRASVHFALLPGVEPTAYVTYDGHPPVARPLAEWRHEVATNPQIARLIAQSKIVYTEMSEADVRRLYLHEFNERCARLGNRQRPVDLLCEVAPLP